MVYMKKYFVDIEKFSNIKNPETSYILGLLWADGHVRKVGKTSYYVGIKALEKDLSEVIPIFHSLGTWGISKYVVEGRQDRISIGITDTELGTVLDNYGFLNKSKLSPCKLLQLIPSELHSYFFRGYFDGDGCITLIKGKYPTILFCGSYEQDFTFIENLLDKLKINYKVNRRIQSENSKNSTVVCSGRKATEILYEYLWQGEDFGFTRKKEKFEHYLSNISDLQRRYITYKDKTKSLRDWSEIVNIKRRTITDRIDRYGWSIGKALGYE